MPFHLALYSASIASVAANVQLAAVADPVLAPAGSGFLVPPVINKIIRVIGQGNLLNRAQLNSASIRDYTPFDINPVNVGTAIETPVKELWLNDNPLPLNVNEEIDCFVTNSGAGATQTTVGVVFADGPVSLVKGRVFAVHWTITTTFAAHGFTNFTPVLDNGIPSGTFALVGSRLNSATALFHRFIPRGGLPYRPGTTSMQAYNQGLNYDERQCYMGEWMRFTNTTTPQIEAFQLAADATADGFMYLIQVA